MTAPPEEAGAIQVECVQVVGTLPNGRSLLAVVDRSGEFELPEGAQELALPKTDRPALRAEAAQITSALKKDAERLAQLAHLKDRMEAERAELKEKARYSVAAGGALAGEELFAIQGWIPAAKAAYLADGLEKAGIAAAVETYEPGEDEAPPTLIKYPAWVRPIKGLFEILGTVPGYRELDLSGFFMIAMPLSQTIYSFILMLIGLKAIAYNPEVLSANAGALFGIGIACGLGEMFSAWMQGVIGAAAVRCMSESERPSGVAAPHGRLLP